MRAFVLAAIVVGGCYSPRDPRCVIACTQGDPATCPSGLTCGTASLCEAMDGPTCNAILDARMEDDASGHDDGGGLDTNTPPPYCSEANFQPGLMLPVAGQVAVDGLHQRQSIASSVVKVNESSVDSTVVSDYVQVLDAPVGSFELYSARIDPTGEFIFATADDGAAGQETLAYYSHRTGEAAWTAWSAMTFERGTVVTLPPGGAFGGSTDPSFTGARRIPFGDTQNGFDEYVEKVPGVVTGFTYVRTFTAVDLGVERVSNPSFTSDGMRVVFIGKIGQVNGIYTATRANLTSSWDPPVLLKTQPVINATFTAPYLTNDCQHLYWTDTNVSRHAVHD